MKCFFCKGDMVNGFTTHVEDLGNCIITIKHVPCFNCNRCGEVSYSGNLVKKIETIIDTLKDTLTETECEFDIIEYFEAKVELDKDPLTYTLEEVEKEIEFSQISKK